MMYGMCSSGAVITLFCVEILMYNVSLTALKNFFFISSVECTQCMFELGVPSWGKNNTKSSPPLSAHSACLNWGFLPGGKTTHTHKKKTLSVVVR